MWKTLMSNDNDYNAKKGTGDEISIRWMNFSGIHAATINFYMIVAIVDTRHWAFHLGYVKHEQGILN